eukprot:2956191-Amphidinium_carterae.1
MGPLQLRGSGDQGALRGLCAFAHADEASTVVSLPLSHHLGSGLTSSMSVARSRIDCPDIAPPGHCAWFGAREAMLCKLLRKDSCSQKIYMRNKKCQSQH